MAASFNALQQEDIAFSGLHVEEGDATAGAPLIDRGTPNGNRVSTVKVTFATPFSKPPIVHASINYLDFYITGAIRMQVEVKNVTTTDFDVEFFTWMDTKVSGVKARWLAIGSSNSTGALTTV
ncbi:H-type lectin domain containing protein [Klebsormidium nitens]|uniref:H-type lectin domain containing protein n=1 Tax=Klebsormidium nitens TaxID=105231 RepID=A0A1Y1I7J2_KLENI|nr:H-type lectin domain containing protein [Klebsormidium nitens]|eukprot:GAQ86935.1 H-type lectin domain containing protein [Klebsormidium nitens]